VSNGECGPATFYGFERRELVQQEVEKERRGDPGVGLGGFKVSSWRV
jgi:hypothetical protein